MAFSARCAENATGDTAERRREQLALWSGVMGLERHEGYWRWVGGPVPPGAEAITLGALIVVRRRSTGSARLLRHELAHVDQWRRLGAIGFLRSYLGAYFRGRLRDFNHREAYLRIPLEEEARQLARQAEPT